MSKQRKRYTPYAGATTTHRSTLSSHIAVVGRSDVGQNESDLRRPSFIHPKTLRLSHTKLKALQQREADRKKKLMQDRMTTRESADLAALQREVSGSSEPLLPFDDYQDDFTGLPDDEWVDMEDDQSSVLTDKPVSLEELGLRTRHSEWSKRLANEHDAWIEQLPALCDAYLAYRSGKSPLEPEASNEDRTVKVLCVDIAAEGFKLFPQGNDDPWINPTIMRHGYLSPSPHRPRTAFSIPLLELVAAVQRRGPSTSVQVMAKALCDLRNVPYKNYFRAQLTAALDAYLMIEHEVKHRLAVAMGRDDPNWRIKHACMACTYTLENEPPLEYSILVTMDGNDSLKRISEAAMADHRRYTSSYYLTPEEVDIYAKDEPRRRGKNQAEDETQCEKRWKSAKPDNDPRKRAKLTFEQTGIFVSTCRHSQVLTVCDMVRSGEQAKYGLSTIDKIVRIFGKALCGYDVGCAFKKTSSRRLIAGPCGCDAEPGYCVGALHASAHHRGCQVHHHARLFPGAGLTDFENCETLFSSSNRLASGTRLASNYHRHQRIDQHLDGWDDDQHANLGYLLRSKYTTALAVIERAEAAIKQLAPDVPSDKLEGFLASEKAYLEGLSVEDPDDTMAIEYLDLREQLEAAIAEYEDRRKHFVNFEPPKRGLRKVAAANCIEARVRAALNRRLALEQAVADFEERHEITIPWTRDMKEWTDAEEVRLNRDLQRCIDDLERLCVQRIFELSRADARGLGYNLRMHVMRAINTRSAALKSALDRYNSAAAKAGLEEMSWDQITKASVLADFDLLRGSRTGILEQEWALPGNRRATEEHQRIIRAKEEILRLNVEIRRVHTAISDERRELPQVVEQVTAVSPGLHWAVHRYVERRLKVNDRIMRELNILMRSNQYTGMRDIGVRIGSRPPQSPPSNALDNDTGFEVDGDDISHDGADFEADDDACDTLDKIQAALENVEM
ncbi:hypothetical protein FRC07_000534 [Ceratobasidium sp. 392]|nr:hypothetical protein FRC07_000534 [Ceratobasidium sp. 392]